MWNVALLPQDEGAELEDDPGLDELQLLVSVPLACLEATCRSTLRRLSSSAADSRHRRRQVPTGGVGLDAVCRPRVIDGVGVGVLPDGDGPAHAARGSQQAVDVSWVDPSLSCMTP